MYSCMMRSAPIAANLRVSEDHLVPAAKIGKGIYTDELLKIIDSCLKLDYMERPQSVFSLQKTLLETVKPLPVKKPSLASKIKHVLNKPL